MNIEYSPTRVTAIAAGNEDRLLELLDEWLAAAEEEGSPGENASFEMDPQTNRVKVHLNGSQNTQDVQRAVRDWVSEKRRLKIDEFSVHEYTRSMEIWRRFEIELRDGAYVATFSEAIGEYKIIGSNGVEIGSISVGPQGWVGSSRSIDSSLSATTTEARDTPREALGELLRTLDYQR